jgi:cold shock CspA family protein
MQSTIKFYNFGKGFGWIDNPSNASEGIYFHISNVIGELKELIDANRYYDEPIVFQLRASKIKSDQEEAYNIKLDLTKRSVGYVTDFNNGFGWIEEFISKESYFAHFSKLKGSDSKFISIEKGDPVVFTKGVSEKGKDAIDIVKVDTRCSLEYFADFDDFKQTLFDLKSKAESEEWDYINNRTSGFPVLYSYINHTFDRVSNQNKIVLGNSAKENKQFAYFNTGLVTPYQDEIYGYFEKVPPIEKAGLWHIAQPQYEFLEFETDQSRYRKYFPSTPGIATYFAEAEVRELIFDTSLNDGKIIVDREHIKNRKNRFPIGIANLDDEAFFDAIAKSIELATKRVKRNYKTAIPHFYDGKIQFLLPLCMLTKRDADLALVVNKEEHVYKAHTVLTLDQALNNARLLAKPDREWLNP